MDALGDFLYNKRDQLDAELQKVGTKLQELERHDDSLEQTINECEKKIKLSREKRAALSRYVRSVKYDDENDQEKIASYIKKHFEKELKE